MLDLLTGLMRRPPTAGAYSIARSLRFNSADSAYLNRTATAGNRRTFTWSGWVKRSKFAALQRIFVASDGSASTDSDYFGFFFNSSDQLQVGGNSTTWRTTTAVYRDPAAWYHVVLAIDSTLATGADRVKFYVNGSEVTAFGTSNNPAQNHDFAVNASGNGHYIGRVDTGGDYFDGYMADVHFVDGLQLTPSSFGETDATTGQWKPKQVSGVTYGTNGFWLSFADNTTTSTLVRDDAGGAAGAGAGSNDWTANNLSVTAGAGNDSLTDTPTNNHATLNPIRPKDSAFSMSNGNLTMASGAADGMFASTMGVSSGKWYAEFTVTAGTGYVGIENGAANLASIPAFTFGGKHYVYLNNGNKAIADTATAYGASFTTSTIGVALDLTVPSVTFYKDGVSQGAITITDLNETWHFIFGTGAGSMTGDANFGQRPFIHTPPTGFVAMCTQNLPTPAIVKPSAQFDIYLAPSAGAGGHTASGLAFQPDLVWIKSRTNAFDHGIYDSVRGVQKELSSNLTNAESTQATGLTAFNSGGYTTGGRFGSSSYVSWCWKEGITPGLDIVGMTASASGNQTLTHNLGVTPEFVIIKSRAGGVANWPVWHTSFGTDHMSLNLTSGRSASGYMVSRNSTQFVFSVNLVNASNDLIAYLFASVAGFSKFGSYTGNGSADGPFVHCGFRPRFLLVKRTDSTGNWVMHDAARSTYNAVGNQELSANSSGAEPAGADRFDFVSNGFKVRSVSASDYNISGATYIFAAFAESPFKYANAR